jgi:hypothetical protein
MKRTALATLTALAITAGALVPRAALAWDTITAGQVSLIEVNNNGSFGVQLAGVANLCPNMGPFAWFDPTWPGQSNGSDGAKALLAVLHAAKLAGLTVTIYGFNGGDGMCHIGVIDLH